MGLPVATTAQGQLAYILETVPGETPATGKGTMLRLTGESLSAEISKDVSKELNATRQTAGMFLTDSQVSGGFQFEVSAGEYDPILEALLMDTWSTFGVNGKSAEDTLTIAVSGQDSTITFGGAAPAGLADLVDGCWLTVSGENLDEANRKPQRVKSVDATAKKITVYGKMKAQSVTKGVVHHSRLTNGVTDRAFTLEKGLAQIQQYFIYRGCRFSKGSWNFESKAAVTGSFEIIGMSSETADAVSLGDKTAYTPSKAEPIIDAVLGMDNVLIDGKDAREEMTAGVQKMSLEFDNNLKGHEAIGVLGNVGVTAGVIKCSGNITMYFANGKIYNDVIRQRRFNVSLKVFDRNGHGYAFTLPSVELSSPKVNISDNDSAVMIELEYTALMDPTTRKTIYIDRF